MEPNQIFKFCTPSMKVQCIHNGEMGMYDCTETCADGTGRRANGGPECVSLTTTPKGSDHGGPLLKSAAQTAITQHFAPSAGARRGANHTASIAHKERTCARKKRLGNGSMFDSYNCVNCCKHLSRNSHSTLRPASGTGPQPRCHVTL